jgi:amidohydrolase
MHTEKIKALVSKHYDKAVKIRHHLHMYPEISFEEVKTAELIAKTLTEFGIETQTGVTPTGVMGIIRGGKPGKTVLLRADTDALSMTEETDVEYKSKIPGAMHACGHDGHTAGLLLCAMVLNEMKDELCGSIKLMFQPGEETEGGALPMIEEGILENPKVDAAFACHLWGAVEEGTVLVKNGPTMAAPDEIRIKIIGKGGHGSMPHEAVDPIVLAAQVINCAQTIISRRKSAIEPAVLSFCSIQGGSVHNIIPPYVQLIGTIRTFDDKIRQWIPKALEDLVAGITKSQGGDYEFQILQRYPPLINDEKMTSLAKNSITKIVGGENVRYMKEPIMGGEDFAYLCQEVPSAFFFVGIAKDEPVIHHNPKFVWDDKNMLISSACLCQIAVDFLND